jgi:hypothetical protein
MKNRKSFFLSSILLIVAIVCKSQDSLCFDKIDKYVKQVENQPCNRLDTGTVKGVTPFRFRDCYKLDSAGKVAVIESSVGQSASLFIRFFFVENSLVKVETGEFNGGKKMNTKFLYYTSESCQFFNPYSNYELDKMYYLRLSELYLDRLKAK